MQRRLRSARTVRLMLAVVVFALGLGGVWWTGHNTGVFLAEVDVVLLPPQGEDPNNALTDPSRGFVDFAGIVAKSVMGASSNAAPVSESVTLVGMGVSEGWVVRQPNDGGQWTTSFSRPVLNVQATSHDPDQALARLQGVVAKIRGQIDAWQDTYSVAPRNRAAVTLNPTTPALYYYNGDRKRAAAGIVAVTVLVMLWLLVGGRRRPPTVARRPRVRAMVDANR